MTALRIGDPVQIDETTEVLTLVCLDGEYAWVRDGAGNYITHKVEDLVRARSAPGNPDADRLQSEAWRESRSKLLGIRYFPADLNEAYDNGFILVGDWNRIGWIPTS